MTSLYNHPDRCDAPGVINLHVEYHSWFLTHESTVLVGLIDWQFWFSACVQNDTFPKVQYLWSEEQCQCHGDGGMGVCELQQEGPVRMKTGMGKTEDRRDRNTDAGKNVLRYFTCHLKCMKIW